MVRSWMLWQSDALKHEHYNGLVMDSAGFEHARYWFGHGCFGNRMRSNMNVIIICYHGLAVDALVIGCARTCAILGFWNRCTGARMLLAKKPCSSVAAAPLGQRHTNPVRFFSRCIINTRPCTTFQSQVLPVQFITLRSPDK